MKKTIFLTVLTAVLVLSSCDNKTPYVYDYTCERPSDIPAYFKDGTPVDWDCNWNAYYKEGLVTVVRDSEGDPIALARKTTGDDFIKPPRTGVEFDIK